jgi:hypothetical protein
MEESLWSVLDNFPRRIRKTGCRKELQVFLAVRNRICDSNAGSLTPRSGCG